MSAKSKVKCAECGAVFMVSIQKANHSLANHIDLYCNNCLNVGLDEAPEEELEVVVVEYDDDELLEKMIEAEQEETEDEEDFEDLTWLQQLNRRTPGNPRQG